MNDNLNKHENEINIKLSGRAVYKAVRQYMQSDEIYNYIKEKVMKKLISRLRIVSGFS